MPKEVSERITVQVLAALPATTASILPDGNPVTLTVAQPGQEAHATFEGIAGARVSLVAETRGGCFTINLHGPDGLGMARVSMAVMARMHSSSRSRSRRQGRSMSRCLTPERRPVM